MREIVYIKDGGTMDYCAIYIDGKKVVDCEVYELNFLEIIDLLRSHDLLKDDISYSDRILEMETEVEFPDTI